MLRTTAIDRAIAQLEQQIRPLQAQIDAKQEAITALRAQQVKTPKRARGRNSTVNAALSLDEKGTAHER